jgi:hypothetical protein
MDNETRMDLESRIIAIHAEIECIRKEIGLSLLCINSQDYTPDPRMTGNRNDQNIFVFAAMEEAFKELAKHDPIAKAKQELKEIDERREKLLKITEGESHG